MREGDNREGGQVNWGRAGKWKDYREMRERGGQQGGRPGKLGESGQVERLQGNEREGDNREGGQVN